MKYRATFVVGAAVGYVLGTKAGRERYEQIKRASRRFSENPTVQEAAGVLRARGGELAGSAKEKAGKLAADAREKVGDQVPGLHRTEEAEDDELRDPRRETAR